MFPRKFALIGGIILLAIGVLSLIFVGSVDGLPVLRVQQSYGNFLGLFPINILNKLLYIGLGIAGILAANAKFTSLPSSIRFSRVLLFITAIGTIIGLFPQTNTLNGYMPFFGNLVWLHALLAVAGGYFGYALTSQVPDQSPRGNSDFRTPAHGTR